MDSNAILLVTNRSSHRVGYPIPETDNQRWRSFNVNETKKITYGELEAAVQQDGCRTLFEKYLLIQNPEVAEDIMNKKPELEYFMTAEQVKDWLPTCQLDELLDALDFAPDGVLTLIKKYAVELPLNDMNKCEAIKEKLKFDVQKAIEIDKESKVPIETEEQKKARLEKEKAEQAVAASKPLTRRVATAHKVTLSNT